MIRSKKISFMLFCWMLSIISLCEKVNASKWIKNASANDVNLNSARDYDALKRDSVVKIPKLGLLQGSIGFTAWTNQTIYQFLNVPYAESPSGPRRFKAPVPVKPWNGIRNAERYGNKCPVFSEIMAMSKSERDSTDLEDCLIMAIFSTNLNASFPVMVYIHGGGFYSNNADHYPSNYMMERDIVLVVIQFRLDALGFLSTNTEEIPGNAGQLDAILALKFVKENIEYFGGDPNQITIFGQSSGAAMVSALVISPSVPDDLFHKAIIQSGSILANWAYNIDPISDARRIAQEAGINPNQSISAINSEFMSMSVYNLLKAVDQYQMKSMLSGNIALGGRSITIGGPSNFLPDRPENIIKSKNYNKSIPIIIGTTKDDGSFLATVLYDILAATKKLDDQNFMVNQLVNYLSHFSGITDDSGSFDALASFTFWTSNELLSGNFSKCASGIIDMLGMTTFKASALKFAQANARFNPNHTYLYTFDYKGEHTRFGYGGDVSHYPFSGGVHHSDDLIYLFPDPPDVATLNRNDTKMAQTMIDLWTSFAIEEIPTRDDGHIWKPFSGPLGDYLHIDTNLRIGNDFRNEFTVQVREQRVSN